MKMTEWYQVEFFSHLEQRWVPLFAREKTSADAQGKMRDWLGGTKSRVVKVTQTMEVVTESGNVDLRSNNREINA